MRWEWEVEAVIPLVNNSSLSILKVVSLVVVSMEVVFLEVLGFNF